MKNKPGCLCHNTTTALTRRQMLEQCGMGFGGMALAWLLNSDPLLGAGAATDTTDVPLYSDLKARPGHFPATAKSVIQLFQSGGASQIELFERKPELVKHAGQPCPGGVETFQPNNNNILMPSVFGFKRYGKSGMELSELIPGVGSIADDMCLIRSMYTEHNNHAEAQSMMATCKFFPGRPAMGAWVSYALGTVNQNLPAYVVLRDPSGYSQASKVQWTCGFLPALYAGVELRTVGSPIHHLDPEMPIPPGAQENALDFLAKLNASHEREHPSENELDARIQNYELAARMQLAAAEVLDLSKESDATKKLYGLDNPVTAGYGTRCLMARRLVEAGVRFVQILPPDPGWDHHKNLRDGLQSVCAQTDIPSGALVKDLKSRGLIDSTVVFWTGEFGRLPITQGSSGPEAGRDHNRFGFSLVMAGGGFKSGFAYGATDEFGYRAVTDRVSVPDLHASVYYLLGLDHNRLKYPYHGILETPTDAKVNGAKVVGDLLKSPPKA